MSLWHARMNMYVYANQLIHTHTTTQVVMAFEDEFTVEIPDAEAEKIHTIAAAVEYISSHPQAK
jgi:hypothetical protein